MSKIFKPRRGTLTTMTSTDKKNTVLAKGEMFIEVPNNGVGTGPSRLVMGNGTDTYATISDNHKYAIDGISGYITSEVAADSTATTATNILNDVDTTSGPKAVRNLFGNLKKAVAANAAAIASINDDLSKQTDLLDSKEFPTADNGMAVTIYLYKNNFKLLHVAGTATSTGANVVIADNIPNKYLSVAHPSLRYICMGLGTSHAFGTINQSGTVVFTNTENTHSMGILFYI